MRPVEPQAAELARLPADEDVVLGIQVRKSDELLVDDGNAGRLGRGDAAEGQRWPADQHLAGLRPPRAGEDLDNGGFARAVLAAQRVPLAGGNVEADVLERLDPAVALADMLNPDQFRH